MSDAEWARFEKRQQMQLRFQDEEGRFECSGDEDYYSNEEGPVVNEFGTYDEWIASLSSEERVAHFVQWESRPMTVAEMIWVEELTDGVEF